VHRALSPLLVNWPDFIFLKIPSVRLKKAQKNRQETAQCQHRFYSRKEICGGGLQQNLEPIDACRLGVDIEGSWRSTRKVPGWENSFMAS
jgi:hypothetical protein